MIVAGSSTFVIGEGGTTVPSLTSGSLEIFARGEAPGAALEYGSQEAAMAGVLYLPLRPLGMVCGRGTGRFRPCETAICDPAAWPSQDCLLARK